MNFLNNENFKKLAYYKFLVSVIGAVSFWLMMIISYYIGLIADFAGITLFLVINPLLFLGFASIVKGKNPIVSILFIVLTVIMVIYSFVYTLLFLVRLTDLSQPIPQIGELQTNIHGFIILIFLILLLKDGVQLPKRFIFASVYVAFTHLLSITYFIYRPFYDSLQQAFFGGAPDPLIILIIIFFGIIGTFIIAPYYAYLLNNLIKNEVIKLPET